MRRFFQFLRSVCQTQRATSKPVPATRARHRDALRRRGSKTVRKLLGGNCFESLESRLAMDGAMSAWSVEQLPTYGSYDAFRAAVIARAEHDFATKFGQPIEAAQPIDYGLAAGLELYASDASDLLTGVNYSTPHLVSGTIGNNQVAGVDESGRAETDGSFVYLLRDGKLEIVDVRDPAQPRFVSTTTLDGWVEGEYLFGSRLTVISSEVSRNLITTSDSSFSSSDYADSLPGATLVTVYDVSDPNTPQIVEKTRLDGNYVDSRAVDDKVYVILASAWPTLPAPEAICDSPTGGRVANPVATQGFSSASGAVATIAWNLAPGFSVSESETANCKYETHEAWMSRISGDIDAAIYQQVPHLSSNGADGRFSRAGLLYEPGEIVKPLSNGDQELVTIVSFDVDDDQVGPVAARGVGTDSNSVVYASADHLILAATEWNPNPIGDLETSLVMMSWDSETGNVFVSASGHVPGVVHDRFSIDEHDGLIRVVTMSGMWTGNGSGLFVLRQNGTELDVIGEVRGIAPGESVQSVRFFDDEAFIVTFLNFDPLFAIDLSDPTNPQVAGQLELPGFSGYLQMLDDTHLLGIGSDGQEKASLFDVSDLSNPRLLDTCYLDPMQSTQSQWDPQAVTWLPDERLLVLPVDTTHFSIDESTGFPFATGGVDHGLLVLRLDMTSPDAATPKLTPVGELADDASVTRSWRIGDYLMALSDNGLMSARLDAPTVVVSDLPLTPLQPTQPGGLLFGPSSWFNPRLIHPTVVGSTPGIAEDLQSENGRIAVIVQAATEDLAQRLGVAASDVMMISAEAATWLDGQLGLTDGASVGEPGESVEPVPGVAIVLEVDGRKFLYHADNDGRLALVDDGFEFGESEAPDWHNADNPTDVTADGVVSPRDALAVIDELNTTGARLLRSQRQLGAITAEGESGFQPRMFWDVNGDRYISPSDALWVINRLNAEVAASVGAASAASNEVVASDAVEASNAATASDASTASDDGTASDFGDLAHVTDDAEPGESVGGTSERVNGLVAGRMAIWSGGAELISASNAKSASGSAADDAETADDISASDDASVIDYASVLDEQRWAALRLDGVTGLDDQSDRDDGAKSIDGGGDAEEAGGSIV